MLAVRGCSRNKSVFKSPLLSATNRFAWRCTGSTHASRFFPGSIVLDGPSALRRQEAVQLLQAPPTCLGRPIIDLQCLRLPGDRFSKVGGFLQQKRLKTQKEKTGGDVDQQRVQRGVPGADPEVEEGGGTHRVGLVRPCGARSAPNFTLRTYNAQHSRRVWGHAPLGKFLSLDRRRPP